MNVIFAGTPAVAVPGLVALHRAYNVVGVLTRPDAPIGRKHVMSPSPVAVCAEEFQLPTHKTRAFDEDALEFVARAGADIGVVVAYGALIPGAALNSPTHGWINAHFSHLPQQRGAAPLQRDIIAGESHAGLSIFRLVPALDAGDLFDVSSHELGKAETAGEALNRLSLIAAERLASVAADIVSGNALGVPQVGTPTYAHKLTSDDGHLRSEMAIGDAFNRYRGVTPEPGAWISSATGRIKIIECTQILSHDSLPGSIETIDGNVRIGFRGGAMELLRVQPAGKSVMPATDWARGLPAKMTWTFE